MKSEISLSALILFASSDKYIATAKTHQNAVHLSTKHIPVHVESI